MLDISKTQSFTKLLFHVFIFTVIFCAELFEDLLICKCLQIPLHNMLWMSRTNYVKVTFSNVIVDQISVEEGICLCKMIRNYKIMT